MHSAEQGHMPKIGLKLWSTNMLYIQPARALYEEGVFDYVELLVVPGSEADFLQQWKQMRCLFSLHAPYSAMGFNFSLREFEQKNRALLKEVESFRLAVNPAYIDFHSGASGTVEETIRQIKLFKSEYENIFNIAVMENKPMIGLNGELCVGASPEEIKMILDETGLGFCLDFGHASCYTVWRQVEYEDVITQFLKLHPKVFHLSDGRRESVKDRHDHFGEGNFDLSYILSVIPTGSKVTIECRKGSKENLDDFKKNVSYLKEFVPA